MSSNIDQKLSDHEDNETQAQLAFSSSASSLDSLGGALIGLAAEQAGVIATDQLGALGFSDALVYHYVRSGRLDRVQRGIYRLAALPLDPQEEYVAAWLWSGRRGLLSHESALALHELSDALPARIHITLPGRRSDFHRKIPDLYVVHFSDVPERDRTRIGAVPLTRPARTVLDVAADHGDADLVEQAIGQGIARGLFRLREVAAAAAYTASLQEARGFSADDEALLAGRFHLGLRGRFASAPPADWPGLAAAVAERYGARLVRQVRPARGREVLLELSFRRPPDEASQETLRRDMGRTLGWT